MKGAASQPKGNNNQPGDLPAGIGQPATRALHGAGYTRLQQLTKVSEKDILQLHGVGPKAIRILKETLQEKGLTFAEPKK